MKVIDAHHHLWDPVSNASAIGYAWLRDIGAPKPFGDPTPIQRDYLAPEYLAESDHEIIGSVHVQADGGIPDPVRETRWVDAIAKEHGIPSAIVGFVDLAHPDAMDVVEQHLQASPLFRGVRQIIARTPGRAEISFAQVELLDDRSWRENFARLGDYGLSFDLQLHPAQMDRVHGLLAENPDVPVVIDHAGSPHDQSVEGFRTWHSGIARLAELPHVYMKISGLGMFDPDWTSMGAPEHIDAILNAFGAERVMFGSNYPVDKLFAPFDELISAIASRLTEDQQGLVFAACAQSFYRIERPTGV